jgi:hypothetical protein
MELTPLSLGLGLLPLGGLAAFLLLFLNVGRDDPVVRVFLRAYVVWLAYLVLITEGLSLFGGLTKESLAASWLLPIIAVGLGLGWRSRGGASIGLNRVRIPEDKVDRGTLGGIAAVLLATLAVALIAPPQTWDSLNYHMSRVAHWAQDRSVAHFATGIEKQNAFPPGAEFQILQSYILSSSDRFANLPQWLALLVCGAGAAGAAQALGLERRGQWLAAALAVSIPMAVVQATSTMNDLAVAALAGMVALEALSVWRGDFRLATFALAGLGAGLAILTKPTAIAFVLPFGVLMATGLIRARGLRRSLAGLALALGLALLPNVGTMFRNWATYGSPLGPREMISGHSNQSFGIGVLFSNLTRGASLHLWTPSDSLNQTLESAIRQAHAVIGLDVNDPRTTCCSTFILRRPSREEDFVGNPLHLLALAGALVLFPLAARRAGPGYVAYTVAWVAAVILFAGLFKWQIFGSRLQTGLFVLGVPFVAATISILLPRWVAGGLALVLVASSMVYVIGIHSRPLARMVDGKVETILGEDRARLLFANGPQLDETYTTMAADLADSGCSAVGIMLSGNAAEYPLWSVLGAPRDSLHLEWIVSGTPSARYAPPDFRPCGIVCEDCPDDLVKMRGLSRVYERENFQLFLAEGPGDG